MKDTCVTCRFFEDLGDGTGSCLRNPPQLPATAQQQKHALQMVEPADGTFAGIWPVVPGHAWCGEHKPAVKSIVPAGSPAGAMSLEQALAEFGAHVKGSKRKPLAAVLANGPNGPGLVHSR